MIAYDCIYVSNKHSSLRITMPDVYKGWQITWVWNGSCVSYDWISQAKCSWYLGPGTFCCWKWCYPPQCFWHYTQILLGWHTHLSLDNNRYLQTPANVSRWCGTGLRKLKKLCQWPGSSHLTLTGSHCGCRLIFSSPREFSTAVKKLWYFNTQMQLV